MRMEVLFSCPLQLYALGASYLHCGQESTLCSVREGKAHRSSLIQFRVSRREGRWHKERALLVRCRAGKKATGREESEGKKHAQPKRKKKGVKVTLTPAQKDAEEASLYLGGSPTAEKERSEGKDEAQAKRKKKAVKVSLTSTKKGPDEESPVAVEPPATKNEESEGKEGAQARRKKKGATLTSKPVNDGKSLVVVESPAKAKTIQTFLPKADFIVESCVGHVRDLPDSAKRIPQKYKGLPWSTLGVNVEEEFEPLYVMIEGKQPIITHLRRILRDCSQLILATDEDREGEAIAWHLLEVLKPKVPVGRAVFHEITQEAISSSFAEFRQVDMNLVKAQETRRILDRLAGYTMSPLLWKKITRGLSAGRVQSVAMDIVVKREDARLRFVSSSYWSGSVSLALPRAKVDDNNADGKLTAKLIEVQGRRLAASADFNSEGRLVVDAATVLWLQSEESMLAALKDAGGELRVRKVEMRLYTRQPPVPLITSTLQRLATSQLRLPAAQVMRLAQKLYEGGYITYMRTDNPGLSTQAEEAGRDIVTSIYGKEYLGASERAGRGKTRSRAKAPRSEAHEAIRPAGTTFRRPAELQLTGDELKLYQMIYDRTVASVMAPAQLESRSVILSDAEERHLFRVSTTRTVFAGYTKVYRDKDDEEALLGSGHAPIAAELEEGDRLQVLECLPQGHHTLAPARYTDGSLVKELETRGVGRPSTYATVIDTLERRGYVIRVSGRYLVPSLSAFAVDGLLATYFPDYVDAEFTARMEAQLDLIAKGEGDPVKYLHAYYLDEDNGLKPVVEKTTPEIDKSVQTVKLPGLVDAGVEVRVGPYGPFLIAAEKESKATIPPKTLPEEMNVAANAQSILKRREDPCIGIDPATGAEVLCKVGPYGPYVQLGRDNEDDGVKAKRARVPPDVDVAAMDVDSALKLLSLPRTLGAHPDSGEPVVANIGRFGPYITCKEESLALRGGEEDVYTIGLDRAVQLLAEKQSRRRKMLASLGEHKGERVEVWTGRYGPYLKYLGTNTRLPDHLQTEPEQIPLQTAIGLLMANRKVVAKLDKVAKQTKTSTATKKEATKTKKTTSATSSSASSSSRSKMTTAAATSTPKKTRKTRAVKKSSGTDPEEAETGMDGEKLTRRGAKDEGQASSLPSELLLPRLEATAQLEHPTLKNAAGGIRST